MLQTKIAFPICQRTFDPIRRSLLNDQTIVMYMDLNHIPAFTVTSCLSSYLLYYSATFLKKKVEDIGVEPMTPCVQGRCSSQLS